MNNHERILYIHGLEEGLTLIDSGEYFVDKTTIVYGYSGYGKTELIKTIMTWLNSHVPTMIAFSASNNETTSSFIKMLPAPLIYNTVNEPAIRKIRFRQERIVKDYQAANSMQNIKMLHEIYCPESNNSEILDMKADLRQVRHQIGDEHKQLYARMFANPKIALIFDDCSTELEPFIKQHPDTNTIRDIYMRGRHEYFTVITGIHSTSMPAPDIRANTNNHIFCDKNVVNTWFANPKNSDPNTRKKALYLMEKLIEHNRFYKLVYCPFYGKFYYTVADMNIINKPLCSSSVRQFCETVTDASHI